MGAREDLLAIPDAWFREGRIGESILVFMDFNPNPQRWWAGFGDLVTAGETWRGTGDAISVSDLTTAYQLSADPVTFTLAATEEMVQRAINTDTQVRGRRISIWSQFFDLSPDDGTQPWQPMGSPLAQFAGKMQQMTYMAQADVSRGISLVCEGLFVDRNKPPRGRLTDADQKARFAGDKGCERMPLYENYETRWV